MIDLEPDLPFKKPAHPNDPGNLPPSKPRYLLGPCIHDRHSECPETKVREILKFGRPTGKTEKKFCECPCHVRRSGP